MGDTENGSYGSRELGGYIQREEARSRTTYTQDRISIDGIPVWAFHNHLVTEGEKFENPRTNQSAALRKLAEEETEADEAPEVCYIDVRPGIRLTGKDFLWGFGLVVLIGIGMWVLIVESFVQSGIR